MNAVQKMTARHPGPHVRLEPPPADLVRELLQHAIARAGSLEGLAAMAGVPAASIRDARAAGVVPVELARAIWRAQVATNRGVAGGTVNVTDLCGRLIVDLPVFDRLPADLYALPIRPGQMFLYRHDRTVLVDRRRREVVDGAIVITSCGRTSKGAVMRAVDVATLDGFHPGVYVDTGRAGAFLLAGVQRADDQPVILGRVLGEILDPRLIAEAEAAFDRDNAAQHAEEQAIAATFDVETWVRAADEAGQHFMAVFPPDRDPYLIASMSRGRSEAYREHEAAFNNFRDGGPYSYQKALGYLTDVGRVVRCIGGTAAYDPRFPTQILARMRDHLAHEPEVVG